MPSRHATALETITLDVPEDAVAAYEAALRTACATVGFFLCDEDAEIWRIEGVKQQGENEAALTGALAVAAMVTGHAAQPERHATEAEGWLARTYSSFPEQLVGRRFAVRGTHLHGAKTAGRITLTLDAGIAFGSGEHGSTRGCLRALERVMHRMPRCILDMGTGSGILAMAAARSLRRSSRRRVLASDIEPWSVRVAAANARLNGLGNRTRFILADGWRDRRVRAGGPYDLVFANILARPLCAMSRDLADHLAPQGRVILAGLLARQARMVLAAHRRGGLVLDFMLREGPWATLVLRREVP